MPNVRSIRLWRWLWVTWIDHDHGYTSAAALGLTRTSATRQTLTTHAIQKATIDG